MEFSAHNIDLPGGERTRGPKEVLLREQGICPAVMRSLCAAFPPDARSSSRVADLGCLEGGYTVEFARAGFDAVGIEAREANIAKCEYVAKKLALENLRFVRDDVRNLEKHGVFDAIFCCGLLYHLDQPGEFIETLSRCTRRLLILQTHYAVPDRDPIGIRLSPMAVNEGMAGRWYDEWPEGSSDEVQQKLLWASVGNARAFWPTKGELLQKLREAGFVAIYEQYDFLSHLAKDPYIEENCRSLFIAAK